jgi:hypothetical protein
MYAAGAGYFKKKKGDGSAYIMSFSKWSFHKSAGKRFPALCYTKKGVFHV